MWSSARANATATVTSPMILARLLSPRFRSSEILIQSSSRPTPPVAKIVPMTINPVRVKIGRVSRPNRVDDVGGDVAKEGSGEDGDAPHRRCTRFDSMPLWPIFSNRLAESAAAKEVDEEARSDKRDERGDRSRDQESDHAPLSHPTSANAARASTRSSKSRTTSPMI